MGMPPDTPVEGKLSRKADPSARRSTADVLRQAETSTAHRESHGSQSAAPIDADSTTEAPAIAWSASPNRDTVQRAVTVNEVTSDVSANSSGTDSNSGENNASSVEQVAQQVLEMLRKRLRLERERNRKF
jgi:hypothetical protein